MEMLGINSKIMESKSSPLRRAGTGKSRVKKLNQGEKGTKKTQASCREEIQYSTKCAGREDENATENKATTKEHHPREKLEGREDRNPARKDNIKTWSKW